VASPARPQRTDPAGIPGWHDRLPITRPFLETFRLGSIYFHNDKTLE
jgi:hypothetical protein